MKYEEFIAQVRHRADLASSEEAERATQATLETLAGRLRGNEAAQLAAQLPDEIGAYLQPYYAGIGDSYPLEDFFYRISQREGVAIEEATYHARVICALLAEAVSVGEIDDVRAQLPPDFARLFEVENEGEIPEITEDISE